MKLLKLFTRYTKNHSNMTAALSDLAWIGNWIENWDDNFNEALKELIKKEI